MVVRQEGVCQDEAAFVALRERETGLMGVLLFKHHVYMYICHISWSFSRAGR